MNIVQSPDPHQSLRQGDGNEHGGVLVLASSGAVQASLGRLQRLARELDPVP
jgi:hypothetical protein